MKGTAVLVLATAFLMSACVSPLSFLQQPTVAPFVDQQATEAAMAGTQAAETLNALPTPTVEPATETLTPTLTATQTATEAVTVTLTPDSSITATSTEFTATPTITGTLPTAALVAVSETETLHPRFYGTLPPAIPYGKVVLVNKAKAEVYASLQCTTIDGYQTVIEYPVFGRLKVSAPAGRYIYVAWVGGRQFEGTFSLSKGDDLSMTFYKDKVTIK